MTAAASDGSGQGRPLWGAGIRGVKRSCHRNWVKSILGRGTASTRALGQEDGWLEPREGQSVGEKIKEVRDGRPECVDPAGH